MNLFEMLRRADPNLVLSGGVEAVKRDFGGHKYRALRIEKGGGFCIRTPLRFLPFRRLAPTIGWLGVVESGSAQMRLTYRRGSTTSAVDVPLTTTPVEIPLPLPKSTASEPDDALLEVTAEAGSCFLLVNEIVDRSKLIAACRGRGVEIGPGHQPQIMPGPLVDVHYVEETSVETWIGMYDKEGKRKTDPALWSRYIIGSADRLPVEDGSLDFVFSSHVLEHLVNPLRHLEHWSRKLNPEGVVACVVPDAMGCKDYVFDLSDPAVWEAEYAADARTPTRDHYVRYAAGRRLAASEVDRMMATGFSLHVHFYSRENILFLLDSCVRRGWFAEFELDCRPNNKDFHLILRKGRPRS